MALLILVDRTNHTESVVLIFLVATCSSKLVPLEWTGFSLFKAVDLGLSWKRNLKWLQNHSAGQLKAAVRTSTDIHAPLVIDSAARCSSNGKSEEQMVFEKLNLIERASHTDFLHQFRFEVYGVTSRQERHGTAVGAKIGRTALWHQQLSLYRALCSWGGRPQYKNALHDGYKNHEESFAVSIWFIFRGPGLSL